MPRAGAASPLLNPRDLVRASWQRARENHLDPEHLLSPLSFEDSELHEYRQSHPLASVMPVIRKLLVRDADEDSGMLVAVGDAMGRLLWVEGDQGLKRRAESMMFVEGADWNESVAGTSAPGTALTIDRAVQIRRQEHFNQLVHDWSCTAVPVHDPQTRSLIGVIDITGGDQAVDRHTLPLVQATAHAVETELLVQRLDTSRERAATSLITRRTIDLAPSARAQRAAERLASTKAVLLVLGRDEAVMQVGERSATFTARHSEILYLLATHPAGMSAETLGEAVYNEGYSAVTLRAEMARLKRELAKLPGFPQLLSRPYRLSQPVETDATHVASLVNRGAHRAALAAFIGEILPGSSSDHIYDCREELMSCVREHILSSSSIEVLWEYVQSPIGHDDEAGWELVLQLLPQRSPKRASAVARLEALQRQVD